MITPEELNFVDKLYLSQETLGRKKNRTYLFVFGISMIILFLSLDIIEIGTELSLVWINIKINVPVFLIILSCLLIVGLMSYYALLIEAEKLARLLKKIYKSFNLNIKDLKDEDYNYLEYPEFTVTSLNEEILYDSKIGNLIFTIEVIVLFIITWILPLVSQILCFIKLIGIYGTTWWLLFLYIILGIMNITLLFMMFKYLRK